METLFSARISSTSTGDLSFDLFDLLFADPSRPEVPNQRHADLTHKLVYRRFPF
jgi:hypothetical protein